MNNFSYFIVFYSVVLGLALTELLGGFARLVRARALRKLEPQTALVALLILLFVIVAWIDVQGYSVAFDLGGLWAPLLLAIFYYLAAAVVFPHQDGDHERLADYFRERKLFIVTMLLAAGLLDHFIFRQFFVTEFEHEPAVFWVWSVPYNLAIDGSMIALLFVHSRRANIVLLTILVLIMTIPYWEAGAIKHAIESHFYYH